MHLPVDPSVSLNGSSLSIGESDIKAGHAEKWNASILDTKCRDRSQDAKSVQMKGKVIMNSFCPESSDGCSSLRTSKNGCFDQFFPMVPQIWCALAHVLTTLYTGDIDRNRDKSLNQGGTKLSYFFLSLHPDVTWDAL